MVARLHPGLGRHVVERGLAQAAPRDATHGGRADALVEPGVGPFDRRDGRSVGH